MKTRAWIFRGLLGKRLSRKPPRLCHTWAGLACGPPSHWLAQLPVTGRGRRPGIRVCADWGAARGNLRRRRPDQAVAGRKGFVGGGSSWAASGEQRRSAEPRRARPKSPLCRGPRDRSRPRRPAPTRVVSPTPTRLTEAHAVRC